MYVSQARGNFGASIAISGDLLAIGAPGIYSNEQVAGSVYIFALDGAGQWQQMCRADGQRPGECFGAAVAIEENRFAFGAPGRRDLGLAGRIDLFEIIGRRSAQMATLGQATSFGSAIALSGGRLAVGQPEFDAGEALHVGRVGLFQVEKSGGIARRGWLVARRAKSDANLGSAVALGPDFVAAGAPGMLEDNDNAGFVIVSDF